MPNKQLSCYEADSKLIESFEQKTATHPLCQLELMMQTPACTNVHVHDSSLPDMDVPLQTVYEMYESPAVIEREIRRNPFHANSSGSGVRQLREEIGRLLPNAIKRAYRREVSLARERIAQYDAEQANQPEETTSSPRQLTLFDNSPSAYDCELESRHLKPDGKRKR